MRGRGLTVGVVVVLWAGAPARAQSPAKAAPANVSAIRAFGTGVARRAAALIASPAAWSRDDDKPCDARATTFSLRCALERASDEAAGRSDPVPAARRDNPAPLAQCVVAREGTCGPLFGDLPVLFAVGSEQRVTTGVWRTDMHPSQVWAGKMADAAAPVMDAARHLIDSIAGKKYSARLVDYNNDSSTTFADIQGLLRALRERLSRATLAQLTASPDDFELEVYPGGSGVIRTYSGWFAVSRFSSRDSTLRFQVDTSREVAPSSVDREILRRANEILASDAVWNRADNRQCPTGEKSWSIYCALHDASLEVARGFSHRRPALEIVRVIVEERTKGKSYHHRLMDYNNDPATRLTDVRTLFAEALAKSEQAR